VIDGMQPMQMGRDLALLIPELTLLIAAVLALVAEMVRQPRWSLGCTLAGLAAATGLTIPLVGSDTTIFMGTFRIDALSAWAKLALLPAAALCVLLALPEARGTDREGTFYSLLAFTTLGVLVLAGAGDVMFVILGVLLSSLGPFALVAYPRDDRSTEAAMKYFVFGSVTSAVMAFGVTYWFGATGSTLLSELHALETHRLAGVAGLLAVLVGLCYKAAVAPFHFWAPDAYDGAPLAVAAYLSVVPKAGAVFALAQVVRDLPEELQWRAALAVLAAVSMTYGNLAALTQSNAVRLLAYSSIAQGGYFLLGVVAIGRSGLAIPSLVVFAAAYAAMNVGAFAVVARTGRELEAFAGIGRSAPWTGAAMVLFLLSLVGVPPLGGFVGKLLLFGAAIEGRYTWLAVVAILNSVLSLAVYLRIIVVLYRSPAAPPAVSRRVVLLVGGVALFFTVAIGIAARMLVDRVA